MNEVGAADRQLNENIMYHLVIARWVCLVIVALIALSTFCGWTIPAIGSLFPLGWTLMKANTAVCFLLSVGGLIIIHRLNYRFALIVCYLSTIIVLLMAGMAIFGHISGRALLVDTLLAPDRGSDMPGRMSIQTASYFVLMGLILISAGFRNKPSSLIADVLVVMLWVVILVIISGYSFDASYLFGHSPTTRTSPQSLVCMVLLGFALVVYRSRSGLFSVFVGVGIGSQAVRILFPFALLLPFLIVGAGAYSIIMDWLTQPYVAAISASSLSALLFVIIILLGTKINSLERELRNQSLTDELTRIYNRRAFYILGEHSMFETKRTNQPLTVLFFDLDGLKIVNDSFGHDTGSRLLQDFANLLRSNFRSNDIVARLGGDEFAVVTHAWNDKLTSMIKRLNIATELLNRTMGNPYQVSYSMGQAGIERVKNESFKELVDQADAAMYQCKRHKRKQIKRTVNRKKIFGR